MRNIGSHKEDVFAPDRKPCGSMHSASLECEMLMQVGMRSKLLHFMVGLMCRCGSWRLEFEEK